MKRRDFLVTLAGLLGSTASHAATTYQVVIPANGVKKAVAAPTSSEFGVLHKKQAGSLSYSYLDMSKGLVQLARSGLIRADYAIPSSGKWYWEVALPSPATGNPYFIIGASRLTDMNGAFTTIFYSYNRAGAVERLGIGIDADAKTVVFYYMDTAGKISQAVGWQNERTTWSGADPLYPYISIWDCGNGSQEFQVIYREQDGFAIKQNVPALAAYTDLGSMPLN